MTPLSLSDALRGTRRMAQKSPKLPVGDIFKNTLISIEAAAKNIEAGFEIV